jgi:hypothetical protein
MVVQSGIASSIGAGSDTERLSIGPAVHELVNRGAGRTPPDEWSEPFSEPQVAIGAGRDAVRLCAGGDAGAELGDDAGRQEGLVLRDVDARR